MSLFGNVKFSRIFHPAKDLVYFCGGKGRFQHPGLRLIWKTLTRMGKDFLFKKREFEKLFYYFSPL